MKTLFKKSVLVFSIGCLSWLSACQEEEVPYLEGEQRDINGSWQVARAIMNGEDITPYVDLSQFRLIINADNTYSLHEQLPFIVDKNGQWSFDNPVFPTEISFTPEGSSTAVTSKFVYPIVNGKRMINVTFSAGCSSNKYEYTFERIVE